MKMWRLLRKSGNGRRVCSVWTKISKYIALGFSLLILSTIPYLLFKENATMSTFLVIIIAVLGIGAMMVPVTIEESIQCIEKGRTII